VLNRDHNDYDQKKIAAAHHVFACVWQQAISLNSRQLNEEAQNITLSILRTVVAAFALMEASSFARSP
jgi:hypothetical protein